MRDYRNTMQSNDLQSNTEFLLSVPNLPSSAWSDLSDPNSFNAIG